jgi:hypothetical protein
LAIAIKSRAARILGDINATGSHNVRTRSVDIQTKRHAWSWRISRTENGKIWTCSAIVTAVVRSKSVYASGVVIAESSFASITRSWNRRNGGRVRNIALRLARP